MVSCIELVDVTCMFLALFTTRTSTLTRIRTAFCFLCRNPPSNQWNISQSEGQLVWGFWSRSMWRPCGTTNESNVLAHIYVLVDKRRLSLDWHACKLEPSSRTYPLKAFLYSSWADRNRVRGGMHLLLDNEDLATGLMNLNVLLLLEGQKGWRGSHDIGLTWFLCYTAKCCMLNIDSSLLLSERVVSCLICIPSMFLSWPSL